MLLEGRAAFVTGAGGRVGRRVCSLLAEEGAKVAASDVDAAGALAAAGDVAEIGRAATAVVGDISRAEDVARMIQEAEDAVGPIDILVNVAAIFPSRLVLEADEEQWDRIFDINVKGTMLTCRDLGNRWVQNGVKGAIVNITSLAGNSARIGGAAYCGSKAAVNLLTQCLAIELGPYGIRVNAVSPGLILDQVLEATEPDTPPYVATILAATPMRRSGSGEDIARAVVFLASDQSDWTTGAILDVGGGIHAGRPHLPLPGAAANG